MATKVKTGVIDSGAITSALITDASITADDLHTTLDLTGKTVTVATASASDNDTSVASTAYVTTAIANLADSAPSTLNTLNELAAALGDDENFSTTVTNSIATKLPLAGGTITGNLKVDASFTVNGNVDTSASLGEVLQLSQTDSVGGFLWSVNRADGAYKNMAYHAANQKFYRDSSNITMTLASSGNVGIGTDSPSTKLHVHATGASEPLGLFQTTTTGDCAVRIEGIGGEAYLEIANTSATTGNTSNSWGIGTNDDTNLHIAYGTNGTMNKNSQVPYVFVNSSSGNVGIGTDSPIEKLDVNSYTGIAVNNNYAHMGSTVSGGMAIFGHNIKSDSANNTIKSANTGYHSSMIKMYYNEGITFHATSGTQTAGNTFYDISGTTHERMRITNAGNVGIGTISPDAKLHVYNNSANNYSTSIRLGQSYNTAYSQISSNFGGSMTINAGQGGGSPELILSVGGTEKLKIDTNHIRVFGDGDRFLKSIYRKQITVAKNYVALFNVEGDQLSSSFVFSCCGTGASVVVNGKFEVILNHYQDIVVRSLGTYYTGMKIKVVSNGNEDCTVYGAINSTNATSLSIEVEPMNNEAIEFSPSSVHSTRYHIHEATAGQNITNTGAMAAGAGTTVGYT